MMTKEEHILYWKSSTEENWETAVFLKTGHQNLFSLFAFHLVVEKLLKAHWVKDNIPNSPPRIDDLPELFKQTELELTFDQVDYLNTNQRMEHRWALSGLQKKSKPTGDQFLSGLSLS
jgi:HEPN domain-containing protein